MMNYMLPEISVIPSEDISISNQLLKHPAGSGNHLVISQVLTKEELEDFKSYCEEHYPFSFNKLSLHVTHDQIQTDLFEEFIKELNSAGLLSVELVFSEDEVSKKDKMITETLTNNIAPITEFPLQIRVQKDEKTIITSPLDLSDFQKIVISNIQKRNHNPNAFKKVAKQNKKFEDLPESMKKSIELKTFLTKKKNDNRMAINLSNYISFQVDVVQEIDDQIDKYIDEEVLIEDKFEIKDEIQENHVKYEGILIGFQEFKTPPYEQEVIRTIPDKDERNVLLYLLGRELFANLPHAIKYVTPKAAEVLAANLRNFVTLNKENLPDGFLLKKTDNLEWVLDYDASLENIKGNLFTPKINVLGNEDLLYDINIKEQSMRDWIGDKKISRLFDGSHTKKLSNMWVRYGDEGVISFFKSLIQGNKKREINDFKETKPEILKFIITKYLDYFTQWDHLYNNQKFFSSIDQINEYDDTKLHWFKQFLVNTGSSRHDLAKTTNSFNFFWVEFTALCEEKNLTLDSDLLKNVDWVTPEGGNPSVYMERLLRLLKNSRDIEDQLKNLSSKDLKNEVNKYDFRPFIKKELFNCQDPLLLDNYGASYASNYEGFTVVSPLMEFDYDCKRQNKFSFNTNYRLYQTDLSDLVEPYIKSRRYYEFLKVFNIKKGSFKFWDDDLTPSKLTLWLVRSSNNINSYDDLLKLKKEDKAIEFDGSSAFDESKFEQPYKLYSYSKSYSSKDIIDHIVDKKPWPLERYNMMAYRFFGGRTEGLLFSSFIKKYGQFLNSNPLCSDGVSAITIMMLFFVSHEHYEGTTDLNDLFKNIQIATESHEVVIQSMRGLNTLYHRDCKLNEREGLVMSKMMSGMSGVGMNSRDEPLPFTKEYELQRAFDYIELNKIAMQKLIKFRESCGIDPRISYTYAIETAQFFSLDPKVDRGLGDNVLLFSGMIPNAFTSYWHKTDDENMKNWMTQVRDYLHKAFGDNRPNNFQYAVELLLKAKKQFPYDSNKDTYYGKGKHIFTSFLKAFDEIALLQNFNSLGVERILKNYKFQLGAELPYEFTKDNDTLKSLMIGLILQLYKQELLQEKQQQEEDIKQEEGSEQQEEDIKQEEGSEQQEEEIKQEDDSEQKEEKNVVNDLIGLVNGIDDLKSSHLYNELSAKKITELGDILKDKWKHFGTLISVLRNQSLIEILTQLKEMEIRSAFTPKGDKNQLLDLMYKKITQVPGLGNCDDFDKLNDLLSKVRAISSLTCSISKNTALKESKNDLLQVFEQWDYSKTEYNILHGMLNLLSQMPHQNYLALLNRFSNNLSFFADQRHFQIFLKAMLELNQHYFPTNYLDSFAQFMEKNPQQIKKCMLIQMEESPTLNTLEIKNENQYIIAEKEIWYFEASENSLKKLDALNKKLISSLLDELKIKKEHFATKDELSLITSYTGHTEPAFNSVMGKLITIFEGDSNDPILNWVMTHPNTLYSSVNQLLSVTVEVDEGQDKVAALFTFLSNKKQVDKFATAMSACQNSSAAADILKIISKSHAIEGGVEKPFAQYIELLDQLSQLKPDIIKSLYLFCKNTPVSLECLYVGLKKSTFKDSFEVFLSEFEKAPFGARDIEKQFNLSEVEREVNDACDLLNTNQNSRFTFIYRKQMMEAFLFVNQIGNDLPVYAKKPIKDLSNDELRNLYAELKDQKGERFTHLTVFQKRLLAIALMREAMYRATGEFAYSKQIIDLIDAIMHEGHLISNIDTGQGKSLIDCMKSALLYINATTVYVTTSSTVDSERDIKKYAPSLDLLGIPYSKKPITSTSDINDMEPNGINFSTVPQLTLFFDKMELMGKPIESDIESLVLNESDDVILDDTVICRFATSEGFISFDQIWIYNEINQFVRANEYLYGDGNAAEDVEALKNYLKLRGQELKKDTNFLENFKAEQYKTWIESALIANFYLQENIDYVVSDTFEKKSINNKSCRTRVVRLILPNGQISNDSTLGLGIHQFLCDKLNDYYGKVDFIIEPEVKTIISSNNKNLLDRFRSGKGLIWGASGSVGSHKEIQEQYTKYSFEFTKSAPHQKNRVKVNKPVICANEEAQFKYLIDKLTHDELHGKNPPSIVFCKDINTATRLYQYLMKHKSKHYPTQLYVGVGIEKQVIQNAGKPGMITITTSILGRNTDIPYDKKVGLKVWHTSVGSSRGMAQKRGRTGRQGSEGEDHQILNKEELGDRFIEDIMQNIEDVLAKKRIENEELYDVVNYLLNCVKSWDDNCFSDGKVNFLLKGWANFNKDCENIYRESKRNMYIREDFIESVLELFQIVLKNHLKKIPEKITTTQIIEKTKKTYPEKKGYVSFDGNVHLSDCTPPVTIAYHLLQFDVEETNTISPEYIQEYLLKLFSNIKNGHACSEHIEYIKFLNSNSITRKTLVEAHKKFLKDYLDKCSHQPTWTQRWLGYESQLNKVVGNSNYLMMFYTFSSLSDTPVVELGVIQKAIIALLHTYIKTSWFVNRKRCEEVQKLIKLIEKVTDLDQLIECINNSKIDMIKDDMEENNKSILRRFKPLNFFGNSRYQRTLQQALSFVYSVNGDKPERVEHKNSKDLAERVNLTETSTLDEVKNRKKKSSGTEKVVLDCLEHSLTQASSSYRKNSLFKSENGDKKEEKENPNDSSKLDGII
jgi:hypothetical protein